jgi:uroporphyrinogen-III synthase
MQSAAKSQTVAPRVVDWTGADLMMLVFNIETEQMLISSRPGRPVKPRTRFPSGGSGVGVYRLESMTVQLALRTVSLESRRSDEMARLLQRHGLIPIEAPSMREVPLADQAEAFVFGEALMQGQCDWLVLLTGVGTRTLVATLGTRWAQPEIVAALARTQLACRGPKPVAALKELGLKAAVLAPEPNTWRDLLAAFDPIELSGKRVWVQEYGRPNDTLLQGLRARGAEVHSAAVYAWQLPEDLEPLRRAVEALCQGEAEAVLFTSAQQLDHLLRIADETGRRAVLLRALREQVLVASIGPLTTEALVEQGLRADIEPEHPKMGHLVKAIAADGLKQLELKRTDRSLTPNAPAAR